MILDAFILAVVLGSSVSLTGWVRHYALRKGMLDHPNHRSSHSVPTPRGGGLAFVVVYLAALSFLALQGDIAARTYVALVGGGFVVAGIGYWDDRQSLSPQVRVLGHLLAAAWAIIWLGGMPPLALGVTTVHWGLLGHLVGIVGLAWMINLFNFMDGIDGIAGSEAAFVAVTGGTFLAADGSGGLAWVAWMLAAVSIGFLFWNWSPAKIFMGDVGSGFLGFILASLAIAGAREYLASLWLWLILLGVFIVDATTTLIRRMIQGEKWYKPHRSHAYQHAALCCCSHQRITLGVLAINLLWLLPWAIIGWQWPQLVIPVTVVSLIPLVWVAVRLGAGKKEVELDMAWFSLRSWPVWGNLKRPLRPGLRSPHKLGDRTESSSSGR